MFPKLIDENTKLIIVHTILHFSNVREDHWEDGDSDWPTSWPWKSEAPLSSLGCAFCHHFHIWSRFKDAAFREWCVLETMWTVYATLRPLHSRSSNNIILFNAVSLQHWWEKKKSIPSHGHYLREFTFSCLCGFPLDTQFPSTSQRCVC